LYSIASAPGADTLEIIYNLVESGEISPRLWECQAGDTILMQGPRGGFIEPKLEANQTEIWWIGNGTGISPYISMIRYYREHDPAQLSKRFLLFGCRSPDDIWFLPELIATVGEHGLRCLICLSSAQAKTLSAENQLTAGLPIYSHGMAGLPIRIALYFGRLTAWPGLHSPHRDKLAMLCGSSLMISEVRDSLMDSGLASSQIFAETYF